MEKRYKHKKTGKIATKWDIGDWYSTEENQHSKIPTWLIENTSDWQLITDESVAEYKILEFKGKYTGSIYKLGIADTYGDLGWSLQQMLSDKDWYINRVRRESDKTEWCVDEQFDKPEFGIRTIKRFVIKDVEIGIQVTVKKGDEIPDCYLNEAIKVPLATVPEWEIMQLQMKGGSYIYDWKDGKFFCQGCSWSYEAMVTSESGSVKSGYLKITKVKYKDQLYTVGDKITAPATHTGTQVLTIDGFRVNDKNNNMLVICKPFSKNGLSIENVKKYIEPKWPAVGDWVRWVGNRPATGKVIGKCDRFNECWNLDAVVNGIKYDSCHQDNLRPATPEEIAEATKPKVEEDNGCTSQVYLTNKEVEKLRKLLKRIKS